jgi:hypothetical protein
MFRADEAEHGVAEIFKALVVISGIRIFIAERWVRESQLQQVLFPKMVADRLLEFTVINPLHIII